MFREIVDSIIKFFDRIIEKEAKRVFEFNAYFWEANTDKGGERLK